MKKYLRSTLLLLVLLVLVVGTTGCSPVPIGVHFRHSYVGMGAVLMLENTTDTAITVDVEAIGTNGDRKIFQKYIPAHSVKEIGWTDGWVFEAGEVVNVRHPNYVTKSVRFEP